MEPDNKILKLAVHYKREVSKYGKNFSWPIAKNVANTYPYRAFKSFYDKCVKDYELAFDDIIEVMKSVIKYANDKKLLNSGTSIICRSDVISICYKSMVNDEMKYDNILKEFETINERLCKHKDLYKYLSTKKSRHGNRNLTVMKCSNKISNAYISLSSTCMKAVLSLPPDEKEYFPKIKDLFLLRNRLASKVDIQTLRSIFGKDLNVK